MKLTITYPESWAEVKYSQYLKYYKAIKPYEGTDDYNRVSVEAAALHFCKVPAELLYQLPQASFDRITETLNTLFESAPKLVLSNQFTVDDTTYGFIPALDEMSYGEYLDLVSYTQKNMWDNIPIIFSILYRPVDKQLGKQYTIQPYTGTDDARIDLFKHILTMDVVFGATAFFLGLQKDLLIGTLAYFQENLNKKTDPVVSQVLETLQKNGVDTIQLQSLLTMTSQNLTA